MADAHGTPIWYELATPDPDDAQAFYATVVGWAIKPFEGEYTGDYRILHAPDGTGVGGLAPLPDGAGTPGWTSYVGVRDVDAVAGRVTELGGSIVVPPTDIPGVGRFATVADPQGLVLHVMRGDSPQASRSFDAAAPGHCSWNELVTSDHVAALAFYGALFGWENRESMAMGAMGDYCFLDHGGQRIGATMTAPPGVPTRWSAYFRVPSIAAASAAVAAAGGTVTMGPMPVPGGDHIILGTDRQGLAFALVGGA